MKICFLAHNLKQDNGAGVFSRRLVLGLKEHLGADVVVFVWESSGEPYEICLPRPKHALIKDFFRIRKIIKECDVVHALDAYPYSVLVALTLIGSKKKFIITAVGSGAIMYLYKWPYSLLLKWAYKKADRVIAISNFTMDEVQKRIPKLKISVINHGVDSIKDEANTVSPTLEKSISKLKPYILSVGSLRPRKGYHLSIKAFALISDMFPNLNYVIVGRAYRKEYAGKLKELIKELHLESKVNILENVDSDVYKNMIYKRAELFFLMSQNEKHDVEGFGLVFLEAARFGLPVVGSKDSGVEDAVASGENGFLKDERSPEEFADAITKILNDNKLKTNMSRRSLSFAKESSWDNRIQQYVSVYSNLLGD